MKSFDEIYEKIYSKSNEELEDIKKFNENVDKKRFNTTIITVLILLIISIIVLYFIKNSNNTIITVSAVVILPFIFILGAFPILKVYFSTSKQEYKTIFKEKVIKELVKNIHSNLEYNLNTGNDPVNLYNSYNKAGFEKYNKYDAELY